MKKSLLVLSLFSLSACSSMRSNTLIDNDFIMSQEQDHREVIETPIAESKLITDEFLSVTLSNGEKINGLIISNYTSAIGDKCWKIDTMDDDLVSICKDENGYKASRQIISGSI